MIFRVAAALFIAAVAGSAVAAPYPEPLQRYYDVLHSTNRPNFTAAARALRRSRQARPQYLQLLRRYGCSATATVCI